MTVTLPESMRDWIESQANLSGADSMDAFVEAVLRAEQSRKHHRLDARHGADAGTDAIEATTAFWAERRRLFNERVVKYTRE